EQRDMKGCERRTQIPITERARDHPRAVSRAVANALEIRLAEVGLQERPRAIWFAEARAHANSPILATSRARRGVGDRRIELLPIGRLHRSALHAVEPRAEASAVARRVVAT